MCFALLANFDNLLHGPNRVLPQLSVVFDGTVSPLLELENGIYDQFLAVRLPPGLGPAELTRVLLSLEHSVAFGTTEFEYLQRKQNRDFQ